MTKITNVLTIENTRRDYEFSDGLNTIIDGTKLLALPGLIDPHVHFRVPGMEHKEDWVHGSRAAFKGGYTTVFDMPNTKPATTTRERLLAKFELIDSQIKESKLPLRYKLFFGADKNNFHQIPQVCEDIVGIKVFMGASTGDLLMDDESSLHAIYAIASRFDLTIALHAEDEMIIQENTKKYADETDFKFHSVIRSIDAAVTAVRQVIELSRLYNVRSYILHLSTREELDLIRAAKADGVQVYAETCPHYLFLDNSMYDKLNGYAKMNPPLRDKAEQTYVWQAIKDGIIDTLGSDHAPHTDSEKDQPLCKCPSGIPGIETSLPLLLTAYQDGKISLNDIVRLTHTSPKKLFKIADNDDVVFANIVDYKALTNQQLCTKVKWSPYVGMNLTGYPEYIYTQGQFFDLSIL